MTIFLIPNQTHMKSQLTRKQFVKLSATAAMALPLAGLYSCAPKKEEKAAENTSPSVANPYAGHPGLQVYTVREQFEKDPGGTLKKIAEVGYKELELYSQTLLDHTREINDLGMKVISTHFLPGYVTGMWDAVKQFGIPKPTDTVDDIIEACARNEVKYMGISILFPDEHKTFDDFKRFAEKANAVGEKAKAAGVQLYYHNHSFEFEPLNGTTPLEAMEAAFDKELVKLELDVFWTTVSGNDPAEWIRKLAGQIKMLHLKDLKAGTPKDYTTFQVPPEAFMALGDGVVDFRKVLEAAHETNIPYAFVEQDHSAIDPFESITRSYKYLQSLAL